MTPRNPALAAAHQITRTLLAEAARLGYSVSVFSGGDGPDISRSQDVDALFEHATACDETVLVFFSPVSSVAVCKRGVVSLAFGNDGWDVIADHTDNHPMRELVNSLNPLVERLQRQLEG
jgi:hypothetical protein